MRIARSQLLPFMLSLHSTCGLRKSHRLLLSNLPALVFIICTDTFKAENTNKWDLDF
jgi:hypothetical protein